MENNLEREFYNKREEYEKALAGVIKDLDSLGEFDIYLHQVGPSFVPNDDPRRIAGTRETMLQIMKCGLDTSDYGSLSGTAMAMGTNHDYDIKKIVEYSYYDHGRDDVDKGVCIIAIPRYITIDGKKIKFSFDEEAMKAASDRHYKNKPFSYLRGEHLMRSVFDCIKRGKIQNYDNDGNEVNTHMGALPREFMLCFQEIIVEDSSYRLINPKTHIAYASNTHKKAFADELARIVKSYFEKYKVDNNEDLLYCIMEEDEPVWADREIMDESGW